LCRYSRFVCDGGLITEIAQPFDKFTGLIAPNEHLFFMSDTLI
jgi:hypothetical protein